MGGNLRIFIVVRNFNQTNIKSMFQFVSQIELGVKNYNQYTISDSSVYAAATNRLVSFDIETGMEQSTLEFQKEIQEVIPNSKSELIVFMGKQSKRVNLTSFEIIEDREFEKYRISPQKPYQQTILVRIPHETDPDIQYRGLYSITTSELIWKQGGILNPTVINGYLLSNGISKICHYDLGNGSLLWEQKLRKGEVSRFIGIHRDLLWVAVNNATVLGLNIQSGEIIHEVGPFEHLPGQLSMMKQYPFNQFNYYDNCFLDEESGKIIGLYRLAEDNWYFEMDVSKEKPGVSINKIRNSSNIPFAIDGQPCPIWPFDKDHIYLCNYRDYTVALFNRKTNAIEHVHEMEVDAAHKTFIITMEVHDERLFVLDKNYILYAYSIRS